MIVLDASVIIKWYNEEEDSDKALEILNLYINGGIKINCPDLVIYEITNAIRYSPAKEDSALENILRNFFKLNLNIIIPTIELVQEAGNIAYKYDITVYDAIYIALAKDLSCQYVTADKKLFNKVKKIAYIQLLTNYSF